MNLFNKHPTIFSEGKASSRRVNPAIRSLTDNSLKMFPIRDLIRDIKGFPSIKFLLKNKEDKEDKECQCGKESSNESFSLNGASPSGVNSGKESRDTSFSGRKEVLKLKEKIEILTELIIMKNKEIENLELSIENYEEESNRINSSNNLINSSLMDTYISYLPYLSILSLSVSLYFIKR